MSRSPKLSKDDIEIFVEDLEALQAKGVINDEQWWSMMARVLKTFGFNEIQKEEMIK